MRLVVPIVLALLAAALPYGPATATSCSGGPANDCIASAIEWFAEPRTFSNAGATMEPGEPTTCDGTTVHGSIWLKLEVVSPGASDPFKVVFDAPFWMTAGVYTRDANDALSYVTCVASWEDEGRHSPVLFLPCTAGTTYWLQLGGQSPGDAGSFSMYETQFRKFNLTVSEPCSFKPTLPTEPRVAAPRAGNGEVWLSWVEPYWDGGRSVGISHYNVYRASACSGPFTLIGSTTWRSHTDAGLARNTSYCYKVTAVNPVGEGPAEPGRSARTWDAPRAPSGLTVARAGDGELRLSWFASPDQLGPAGMSAYRVYRASSADGPFAFVADAAPTARGFNDTGLARGATFHYRVAAVNVVGEGGITAPAGNTTWQLPGAPRDVRAEPGLSPGNQVRWSPPAEDTPFTHYRVYRANSATGPATFIRELPATTTSFFDGLRGVLVDSYYEIRASNPAGEGAASARACSVYPLESPLERCE